MNTFKKQIFKRVPGACLVMSVIALLFTLGFKAHYDLAHQVWWGAFLQSLLYLLLLRGLWELLQLVGLRYWQPVWLSVLVILVTLFFFLPIYSWIQALDNHYYRFFLICMIPILITCWCYGLLLTSGTTALSHRLLWLLAGGMMLLIFGLKWLVIWALFFKSPYYFFWILLVVVMTDTCAFIGGHYGKGRLWVPKISPKKTWTGLVSGTIGGWLTGMLCSIILFFQHNQQQRLFWESVDLTRPQLLWVVYVLTSSLLVIGALGGDLFFSWLKRRFAVKDYQLFIVGHGGLLDRIDGLLGALLVLSFLTVPLMINNFYF